MNWRQPVPTLSVWLQSDGQGLTIQCNQVVFFVGNQITVDLPDFGNNRGCAHPAASRLRCQDQLWALRLVCVLIPSLRESEGVSSRACLVP